MNTESLSGRWCLVGLRRSLWRAGLSVAGLVAAVAGLAPAAASAGVLPVKLQQTGQLASGLEGQGVAVDTDAGSTQHGDVYVAENGYHRVQVFSAAGQFVLMFGWDVNATKAADPSATQAEKNLCTAASGDTCQSGTPGINSSQFTYVAAIAVDPSSGDVYVADYAVENGLEERVQKFTSEGQFILELGRDVNHTTKGNLCTEQEALEAGVVCGGAEPSVLEGSEPGAFNYETSSVVAVGGSEDLLYVGDEHRVQEFKPNGQWVRDIPLTGISGEPYGKVQALTVDPSTGEVDLVYPYGDKVYQYTPAGVELGKFTAHTNVPGVEQFIGQLALDADGHLAVIGYAEGAETGSVYDNTTGRRFSELTPPPTNARFEEKYFSIAGLASNGEGVFYAYAHGGVVVYTVRPAPMVVLTVPASCKEEVGGEASVFFACTLSGEVDPEGVAQTEAQFQWGPKTSLGQATAFQAVASAGAVQGVADVPPDGAYHYQLAASNQDIKVPEQVETLQETFTVAPVAPRVLDALASEFTSSTSTVLAGQVNPENESTGYRFLYAPSCREGQPCPVLTPGTAGVMETETQQSANYGAIPITAEISGLQPDSVYRYALVASNEEGTPALNQDGAAALPEATFTTSPGPEPQAGTGPASAVTATGAVISASLNPDGAPVTYTLELGVWEGAVTQYGVVGSGPVSASGDAQQVTLALTGLQPSRTYAYRVTIHSGDIHNAAQASTSEPALFTTSGLPSLLAAPVAPPQLTTPGVAFPTPSGTGAGHKHRAKAKRRKVHRGKKAAGRRRVRKRTRK